MRMRSGAAALCAMLVLAACAGDDDADIDGAAPDSISSAPAPATEPAAATGALLDPDVATREQLVAVPGMTEAAADALIAARPFQTMLDVDAVLAAQSLDEATRENVYRALWKPLDLNAASAEEILLVPGVGERMKHEFEEYRPYTDIAQFRREMGKYVSDDEVERLAQYVRIGS